MVEILNLFYSNSKDPYLIHFKKSLIERGVNMLFPKRIPLYFPFFRSFLSTNCKIIHIQWIQPFSGSKEVLLHRNLKKLVLFIIDIFIVKFIMRRKIIWTVHNLYTHGVPYLFIDKLGRAFFSRFADSLICHCEQAKIKIQSTYKVNSKKINIAYIGNYLEFYKNNISKEMAREILNLKEEDFVFLYFGRIRYYKGVDIIIESFKRFKSEKSIKLLIAGGISEKHLLPYFYNISKQNESIIFSFKYISEEDIQVYMNASDVVICAFRESIGSASVLVGMGFGKPFIAPRKGCLIDLLDDKGTFYFDSERENGLVEALKTTVRNKDKLLEMGNHNQKRVKNFEWHQFGKKIEDVYQNVYKN